MEQQQQQQAINFLLNVAAKAPVEKSIHVECEKAAKFLLESIKPKPDLKAVEEVK